MKKKKRRLHLNWALYLMLIPGFIYLLFNNYLPMTFTVIAFKKYNFQKGIWGSEFIGFDNFKSLFSTRDSWIILRNTVGYNLIFIAIGLFVGLAIAILLDELNSKRGKRAFQMTYLIPYMISITVVSYIVYALLSTDTGFINNSVLEPMGKKGVSWYAQPAFWPFILVAVNQWKWLGYNSIIYYSSVISIDSSYYEAATIDGATRFQRIMYITIPIIRSTIITMTLLQLGSIFRSDFGLFYQVPMDSSALMNVTNTIDTYVYRGIKSVGTLGMSSAAGLYQSVVGFVLILAANGIVRKIDRDSAIF
ncbi:MAG: ABC transporter permease subunit [Eisenbergiella massiliensis]|nr:ABC transporter permease subunit [Eisenbergiella massiliensis]MCI6705586.1 ABC transporter permease subunit [Eisenbergiella massiliensis]